MNRHSSPAHAVTISFASENPDLLRGLQKLASRAEHSRLTAQGRFQSGDNASLASQTASGSTVQQEQGSCNSADSFALRLWDLDFRLSMAQHELTTVASEAEHATLAIELTDIASQLNELCKDLKTHLPNAPPVTDTIQRAVSSLRLKSMYMRSQGHRNRTIQEKVIRDAQEGNWQKLDWATDSGTYLDCNRETLYFCMAALIGDDQGNVEVQAGINIRSDQIPILWSLKLVKHGRWGLILVYEEEGERWQEELLQFQLSPSPNETGKLKLTWKTIYKDFCKACGVWVRVESDDGEMNIRNTEDGQEA